MNSQRNDPLIVEIAAAKVNNLPALHALLTYCELPIAGVDTHFDTILVAREGQHLVGSVGLECYGTVALLRSVAVAPHLRCKHLGERLVLEVSELRTQHREVHEKWGDVLNMEPFLGKSRGFSHLL